ncbi:hypothetical protein R1CP_36395 (plasmid) [Rhodococcus opacus]|uniref:Acetoacetate decarboxylase n=1 Tax=Rhodococcus opacus TaxID=37919 RepID=A0A1B1KGZ2_RHOOP|nr:acetoacetate decarboxylase family protein [Rhodococcus opacus]ANS31885.1 hypothetical protein R1CP_36395 [Rhodococcus opacus]
MSTEYGQLRDLEPRDVGVVDMNNGAGTADQAHIRWPFSQPFGPAPLYGAPPYAYRDARTITTVMRLDGATLANYLPPGLDLGTDAPLGVVAASDYPETAFGPYRELSFFVRVTVKGRTFMYSPLMYADGEGAIAAGRELWGFAKKTALMELTRDEHAWHFSAERQGRLITELEFRPQQQSTPEELALVDHPTLTLRLIPPLSGRGAPDIAQLVSTVNEKRPHINNDGIVRRWTGVAEWALSDFPADPLGAFRPVQVLASWMTEYDCDLPAGELVHDYVGGANRDC